MNQNRLNSDLTSEQILPTTEIWTQLYYFPKENQYGFKHCHVRLQEADEEKCLTRRANILHTIVKEIYLVIIG